MNHTKLFKKKMNHTKLWTFKSKGNRWFTTNQVKVEVTCANMWSSYAYRL